MLLLRHAADEMLWRRQRWHHRHCWMPSVFWILWNDSPCDDALVVSMEKSASESMLVMLRRFLLGNEIGGGKFSF